MNLQTNEEGEEVGLKDVYNEFNESFAKKNRMTQFKSRSSTKKYCFNQTNIPSEAEYLEVKYSVIES